MNIIDISTKEKQKEVYNIFDSFSKKSDIYEYFHISDNVKGVAYVKQIAKIIGFDFEIYKARKKRYCLQCGKELKRNQKKFCSSSCSAKYNNGKLTDECKKKISESLKKYHSEKENIKTEKRFCIICGNTLKKNQRKYCSKKCREKNYNKTFRKQCLYCNETFIGNTNRKFCSNKCCNAWKEEKYIKEWKNEERKISGNATIPSIIRNYLLKKCEYQCQECSFEGYNKITGNSILQIHHINGDSADNSEKNLQVLCPNCHAMTENFMALNKGKSSRNKRYKKEG